MSATLEKRFSLALYNTARTWRQAVDRRLKDLGVGQASWLAIAVTATAGEPLSQTELAHRLGVEGPTMVATIDRLVKAGFVLREPSPTDRRVKLVVLTAAGNQLYTRVKTEADAFRAELLAHIDAKQLRIATELLETLQATIESTMVKN
jgi:MarR family transcriptional regulator for hemolysin